MRWAFVKVVLVLLLGFGCDPGPNTAFLPVGSRCVVDHDCGTSPYHCDLTQAGGYCNKPCGLDGDCPADSACSLTHCARKCVTVDDCRSLEGYECEDRGATSLVCAHP